MNIVNQVGQEIGEIVKSGGSILSFITAIIATIKGIQGLNYRNKNGLVSSYCQKKKKYIRYIIPISTIIMLIFVGYVLRGFFQEINFVTKSIDFISIILAFLWVLSIFFRKKIDLYLIHKNRTIKAYSVLLFVISIFIFTQIQGLFYYSDAILKLELKNIQVMTSTQQLSMVENRVNELHLMSSFKMISEEHKINLAEIISDGKSKGIAIDSDEILNLLKELERIDLYTKFAFALILIMLLFGICYHLSEILEVNMKKIIELKDGSALSCENIICEKDGYTVIIIDGTKIIQRRFLFEEVEAISIEGEIY